MPNLSILPGVLPPGWATHRDPIPLIKKIAYELDKLDILRAELSLPPASLDVHPPIRCEQCRADGKVTVYGGHRGGNRHFQIEVTLAPGDTKLIVFYEKDGERNSFELLEGEKEEVTCEKLKVKAYGSDTIIYGLRVS